jgi:hypothetical protein
MGLNRRTFLKGLVATTAGVIVPQQVMAEPERRIWALDSTMVKPAISPDYQAYLDYMADPERFTYNFGGSLHSNKITVGDYQADYRPTLFAKTADNDWYSTDNGMNWTPVLLVNHEDVKQIRG